MKYTREYLIEREKRARKSEKLITNGAKQAAVQDEEISYLTRHDPC
jgi:hypothetical protein